MAISGILIPLDGAAISAAILPVVASLARPIHASVHLFAAIDLQKREIQSLCYTADGDASPVERTAGPESAPLNPSGVQASTAEVTQRVERTHAFLGALAARLQALGIESSYEASVGDPMSDIVNLARRKRFGLIALSPHSRYAIGRGLGSVTDRVLHSSPIPILVAPPSSAPPPTASALTIQTVIATLDGSRAAEAALDPARQIAEACGAQLLLLRAIGGRAREAAWEEGAERVGRDIDSDFHGAAMRYMTDASERVGVPCSTMIGSEDEVTEILGAADSLPSSMIVMASQGQSGLTKWRLGSITDRIIRQTSWPVIVVPPVGQLARLRHAAGSRKMMSQAKIPDACAQPRHHQTAKLAS
jgi:nucleotide-binding universal stress UspA family protein